MSLNPIKSALSTFKLVLKETEHKSVSPLTRLFFEATLILSALIIYSMLYRIIEGDITAYLKPVFIAAHVTWLEPFVVWFFPLLVCVLRLNQHIHHMLRSRFFQKHGAAIITPEPHYFRLLPYQTTDKNRYHRADNLHIEVKNWIKQTAHTLLYLTGESGAGKSSLLNAFLVPELIKDNYEVISCHAHADPVGQLKLAFCEHTNQLNSADNWVQRLNQYHLNINKPLLFIIDQFEEFLIMNDHLTQLETAKKTLHQFIEQLEQLNKNQAKAAPIKILLTFRSDYDGLIHDLNFPPMRSRDNWFKVSAFSHQAASQFLQNGMGEISQEHINHILQSVSELEDRKGLYRPITLNFAGFLLVNSNVSGSIDMNKLIQQFFNDLVHDRKHGANLRLLLPMFITAQDTKQPANIVHIAEKSQLPERAIISSLNFLAEKGVAKPIDNKNNLWELSHDFIARKISPVLNQYRTPLRLRLAKHSIAISLGLWVTCVGGVSVFALKPNQNVPLIVEQIVPLNSVGNALDTTKNTQYERPKGIRFKHPFLNDVTLAYLPAATAQKHIDWHGVQILDLSHQISVAHLHTLNLPRDLHTLIAEDTGIFSLADIKWPKGTQHLNFRNTPLSDISSAIWPANLQTLNLSSTQLQHINKVQWPRSLQSLDIRDTPITHLGGVIWPENLQALYADWSEIEDLAQIQWPDNITHLDLSLSNIASLDDITWPSKLHTLQLRYTDISDLAYAQWPRNLQYLDLSGTNLSDLRSAYWPARLQQLNLAWTKVSDISHIRWPKSLREINLSASHVRQLSNVNWPPQLQTLDLSATNIASLHGVQWPDSLATLDLRRTNITHFNQVTWPKNLQALGCHASCFADAEHKSGRKLQNLDQLSQ